MERPRRRSTKQTATTDFNAAHSAPTPVICHQTTRVDLRTGPLSPERPVQFLGPPSSWLTIRHSASSAAALHFPRVRSLEAFGRRPQWPAASVAKGRHPKPFTCVDGSGLARRIVTSQAWSVQPCVWPVCAVHMTAGHNALRGSGPVKTSHSRMLWPMWVVLIAGSTGSALRAVRPPNLHITPGYSARSR